TILVLLVSQLFIFFVKGQKIKYELSFEKAKMISLQQGKPLAILITINPPVPTPNFLKGLEDEKVIEKFNSGFINYKIDREDTAIAYKIIRQYKVYRFPSLLFLDSKGGILFSDIAILSQARQLLELADKAINSAKEKSLVDFDNEYNAGNISTIFLKEYIMRREKSGIRNNADIIEKYVTSLKVSAFNNYDEVLFILKAGPYADSNAFKLAHLNKKLIDSLFKAEPLSTRMAINNATIANTMASAIANKDLKRATAAADFTRGTWGRDYNEAKKSWSLKMLQYYSGINDTMNYLQNAKNYYDQYYMHISVDSIKKKDSLNYLDARNKAMENAKLNSPDSTKSLSYSFSYAKNVEATELNNVAWYFYKAANNNDYLLKAMLWSKRSIELSPDNPVFYDTYAHLLYKLELYDEAESMQRKAIEYAKSSKKEFKTYQDELEKIKHRTL
ncbi:MAG: hypothetical protein ABI091_10160, partial [Ferruginibacter sp.]